MDSKENMEKDMNIPSSENKQGMQETKTEQPLVDSVVEQTVTTPLPETPQEVIKKAPQVSEEVKVNTKNIVPDLHPVHKTRMFILLIITLLLGLVSIISLLFALKTKGNDNLTLKLFEKEPNTTTDVVMESEMEKERIPGEFYPEDVVEELDNLNLENIEKTYLDSGLN